MGRTALLVVDVQNDFVPGGSLAVPNGDEVVPVINSLQEKCAYDIVVYTQDWHPQGHSSFASTHSGRKPFDQIELPSRTAQTLWPDHCVQGSHGAEFHRDLRRVADGIIVKKGTRWSADSYSGFWDNERAHQTDLERILREKDVTKVIVCGLATDFCVGYTALDALSASFETVVVTDASRGIDPKGTEDMLRRVREAGGTTPSAAEICSYRDHHPIYS